MLYGCRSHAELRKGGAEAAGVHPFGIGLVGAPVWADASPEPMAVAAAAQHSETAPTDGGRDGGGDDGDGDGVPSPQKRKHVS